MDIVGKIISFESGEMSDEEVVNFFGHLVKTGMAWSLQGMYGRTATALIEGGFINRDGTVNTERLED